MEVTAETGVAALGVCSALSGGANRSLVAGLDGVAGRTLTARDLHSQRSKRRRGQIR